MGTQPLPLIATDMAKLKTRTEIPMFLRRWGLTNDVVEVGVRFSYNFQQLLSCSPRRAWAIDHWAVSGDPAEQDTGMDTKRLDAIYLDVVKRYAGNPAVRVVRTTSSQAASSLFDIESLDYVYLDADHTKAGCLRDIGAWWPLVRQGGILAGHDYIDATAKNGTPFGVIDAVQTFLRDHKIDPRCLHTTLHGYKTWMLYKLDGE